MNVKSSKYWVLVLAVVMSAGAVATTAWAKAATVAYVANAGNNHIQIVDLETGETLNKIYTGVAPWRSSPASPNISGVFGL